MDKRHFFVSRSGKDTARTVWLCRILSEHGYSYHEQGQWPVGTNFVTAMSDAIAQSTYTLGLYSRHYFAPDSQFTTQEWTAALVRARLVGIKLDSCRIPEVLRPITYIDLTTGMSAAQERAQVLASLQQLEDVAPGPAPWIAPPTTTRVVTKDIRSLPDLCDREEEETKLQRKVKERDGKTVVFVVHGDDNELPEKFASRIEHVGVRDVLTASDPHIRPEFIAWPAATTDNEFRDVLERAVARQQLDGFAAEDGIVISTVVDAETYANRDPYAQVKAYIDFWVSFAAGQACVVVVCLAIRYPAAGWFDFRRHAAIRRMKETIARLCEAQAANCWIAPDPLDAVPRQQAWNWANLPRVRTVADIDTTDIDAIYGRRQKLPMSTVAPKLATLLRVRGRG